MPRRSTTDRVEALFRLYEQKMYRIAYAILHDEGQAEDAVPFMATYPAREYVEVDLEEAERLLGPYTAAQETPVAIGDHTLSIQSAVRDKDTMVVG